MAKEKQEQVTTLPIEDTHICSVCGKKHICEFCNSDLNYSLLFEEPQEEGILKVVLMAATLILVFITMIITVFK